MPANLVILASAARTAATNSSTYQNRQYLGMILTLDVTADPAAASITPSLEYQDPASGNYEKLWTAATAISAVGTHSYNLSPSGAANADIVEAVNLVLPERWRVSIAVADADSMTYSVGASLVP